MEWIRRIKGKPFLVLVGGLFFSVLFIGGANMFAYSNVNTYYVAKYGNDRNSGALTEPFESIQYGINQMTPGDRLYILEGIYDEQLTIDISGTPSYPSLISAYKDGEVILEGSDGEDNDMIYIHNSSYLTISGLTIRNLQGKRYAAGIFAEGHSKGLRIVNNTIYNIEAKRDGHGIAVYGTEGDEPIKDLLIHSNHIYDCILGTSEALVVNGNIDGFVISGNTVHDVDNIGIDCIGYEGTANKNDYSRNGKVFDNVVYNITSVNNPAYRGGQGADGIYVDGGKNIDIYHNDVSDCDIGIEVSSEHFGKSTSGVQVYDNRISKASLYGIAIGGEGADNGWAEENHFWNNLLLYNKTSLAFQQSRNNTFKNNVIIGDHMYYEGALSSNELLGNYRYHKDMSSGEQLQAIGLVKGSKGDLMETSYLKREEVMVLFYRLSETGQQPPRGPYRPTFVDVSRNHWSYDYVEFAYESGIVKGLSDKRFGLGEVVTGRQVLLMLLRVLDYDSDWHSAFNDGLDLGIVKEEDYELMDKPMTRKETFVMIVNFLNIILERESGLLYDKYHNNISFIRYSTN